MSVLAEHPNTIAKVLDSSFKLYVLSFKKLAGLALIIAVLALGFNAMIQLSLVDLQSSGDPSAMNQMLPKIFIGGLIYGFSTLIIYVAMIYRIDNLVNEQEDRFSEALQVGLKKLPKMVLASFLYFLACALGLLLLAVPGIILSVSLLFYPFLLILEGQGSYQSLKNSHKLVWGNWWRTMAVFLVPGVLLVVIIFTLGFVAALLPGATTGFSWVDVVSNLLMVVYLPYFYGLGYVQYHDLKLRAYGGDLEARMAVQ